MGKFLPTRNYLINPTPQLPSKRKLRAGENMEAGEVDCKAIAVLQIPPLRVRNDKMDEQDRSGRKGQGYKSKHEIRISKS